MIISSPPFNNIVPSHVSVNVSNLTELSIASCNLITPLTDLKNTKSPSCSNILYCESLLKPPVAPSKLNVPIWPACLSASLAVVLTNSSTTSNKSGRKSASNASISNSLNSSSASFDNPASPSNSLNSKKSTSNSP